MLTDNMPVLPLHQRDASVILTLPLQERDASVTPGLYFLLIQKTVFKRGIWTALLTHPAGVALTDIRAKCTRIVT